MVTVNGNMLQAVGGKQGTQSKAVAKSGDVTNADFLMALFAAAGQQAETTGAADLLLGGNPEQQQPAAEEQTNQWQQLMELLMATDVPINQQMPVNQEMLLNTPNESVKQMQLADAEPLNAPKQLDTAMLSKLDNLLSNPQLQLTPELEALIKEVQVQLQNQDIKPPSGLTALPSQMNAPLDPALLGKLQKMLTNPQLQSAPEATVGVTQQSAETAVKTESLVAELPKAVVMPQTKTPAEIRPAEPNTGNQDISVTGRFTKQITERPVEQVLQQQPVKNAENAGQNITKQAVTKQTITNQSTENQSLATIVNNKAAGMDAKADLTQPEQLAGRLLTMVKEMAAKQQPNQTTMHLKLHPEHLGEVTIRLSYNRGELNAQFYAATAHGKEALEAALPQMRDALYQQQVKLNDATVYLNNNGNQWFGGRQGNQGGNRGRGQGNYYTDNNYQPKVGMVAATNNSAVDDGLNILV